MSARRAWARLDGEADFRRRGRSLTRAEVLVDLALGLALAQPLASLGAAAMHPDAARDAGHPVAVAALALALGACWLEHHRFHRRFGLDDGTTAALGLALALAILALSLPVQVALEHAATWILPAGERFGPETSARGPAVVAGFGFAAASAVFAALYRRAWNVQWELDLDSVERVLTKSRMHRHAAHAAVGLLAAALALLGPRWSFAAYAVTVPLHIVHARITARTVELFRGRVPGVHRAQ